MKSLLLTYATNVNVWDKDDIINSDLIGQKFLNDCHVITVTFSNYVKHIHICYKSFCYSS